MTNKNITIAEEGWDTQKKILVVLAHPDDPEFFLGATINRWVKLGHEVHYVLLTRGDKGGKKGTIPEELVVLREKEQLSAAKILGVSSVRFMDNPDGYLTPDLKLRREVVIAIRKAQPDIVVGCDPTNLFTRNNTVNHPDHRAAGQAVVDAVFPAAGNYMFYPELLKEGLEPANIQELWLSIPNQPNFSLDITSTWATKIEALHAHASQIGNPQEFDVRMATRRSEGSTEENPKFEEHFVRIKFS